jgi:hypothetical protein
LRSFKVHFGVLVDYAAILWSSAFRPQKQLGIAGREMSVPLGSHPRRNKYGVGH